MSNIAPINSNTAIQSPTQISASQLINLLRPGQLLSVQVINTLPSNAIQFQSSLGQITLNFADASAFVTGSRWDVQTSPGTQNLTLTPQTTSSQVTTSQTTAPDVSAQKPSPQKPSPQTPLPINVSTKPNGQQDTSAQAVRSEPAIRVSSDQQKVQLTPTVPKQDPAIKATVTASLTGKPNTSQIPPPQVSRSEGPIQPSPQQQRQNTLSFHRQSAATTQHSLTGVFATLSGVASGAIPALKNLPEGRTIQSLAQQILGLRVTPNVTPETIKQAIRTSGIFHEAQQSPQKQDTGFIKSAGLLSPKSSIRAPLLDNGLLNLKQLLLNLKTLTTKAGPSEQNAPTNTLRNLLPPPLPEQDGSLQGQRPQVNFALDEKESIFLNRLNEQTTQALSRLKLLQLSSLPQIDQDVTQTGTDKAKVQLTMELPLALTNEQTAVLGLRITKDGENSGADGEAGRSWSVDLALDTEETGSIEANIHLTPKGMRITIWAADKGFADLLNENSESFKAKLSDDGLDIEHIKIFNGKRPDLKKYAKQRQGRYLDQSI